MALSLNNLAGLYESEGKYGAAEPLYQRALKIHENTLGADHPDVATSLNNMAALYHLQGRYVEAEGYFNQALAADPDRRRQAREREVPGRDAAADLFKAVPELTEEVKKLKAS